MRVDHARCRRASMPRTSSDCPQRHTRHDHERDVRVPERVDGHLRQSLAFDEIREPARDAVWVDRMPVIGREQPVRLEPMVTQTRLSQMDS